MGNKRKRRTRGRSERDDVMLERLKQERPDIDWDLVREDWNAKMGHRPEYVWHKKRARKSGVYLISAGSEGPTKIGVAADVEKRRSQLQTGHPSPLAVHYVLWFKTAAAAFAVERWLLEEVDASVRLSGEWMAMRPDTLRQLIGKHAQRHLAQYLCADESEKNQ